MLLRLDLSTEDRWTCLLAGFDILHGPVTSAIMAEAGHSATGESIEERTVEITRFLAKAVIRDWRGVVDDTTGEPLVITPEAVDAVMDIWPIFRAFNDKVIDARIRIDREKKGYPISQNGTSGSDQATAPIATDPAPTAQDA
jgi:hypothetical protein